MKRAARHLPAPNPPRDAAAADARRVAADRIRVGVAMSPQSPGAPTATPCHRLPMPNERDECTGEVDPQPQDVIVQAKKDLDRGLVDTDLRATAGIDDAQRRALLRRAK